MKMTTYRPIVMAVAVGVVFLAPALLMGQGRSGRNTSYSRGTPTRTPTSSPSSAGGGKTATPGKTALGPTINDYQTVVSRNIFVRDHSQPVVKTNTGRGPFTGPVVQPPSHDPEMILFGVGVQDDYREAFFEDSRNGAIVRAIPGQVMGMGTVVAVNLDSVDYRVGAQTRKVAINETLSGRPADRYSAYNMALETMTSRFGRPTGPVAPAGPTTPFPRGTPAFSGTASTGVPVMVMTGSAAPGGVMVLGVPQPDDGSQETPQTDGEAAPAPASQPAAGAVPAGLTVEEQMKLRRRMQEMGP